MVLPRNRTNHVPVDPQSHSLETARAYEVVF